MKIPDKIPNLLKLNYPVYVAPLAEGPNIQYLPQVEFKIGNKKIEELISKITHYTLEG
jgi:hypothetical protein